MAGANPLLDLEGGTHYQETILQKTKELTKDIPDFSFVYSLHFYPGGKKGRDFDTYAKTINLARGILNENGFYNIPIATTDMASFLLKDDPLKEQKVAEDIIKYNVFGLAHDMKTIVWAQLSDGLEYCKSFEAGLISNPSMTPQDKGYYKNLGFYTYKLMTEKLEGSDWNTIETIQEKDGIYIYKFAKQGKPIWVAWNDNPQESQIIISDTSLKQVKITEAIPKYASGKEVMDYNTAFNTKRKDVKDGEVIITLKETPVFVEER